MKELVVITAVPTREIICAPSEMKCRGDRREKMKVWYGGDDEKGKEEEWDRAVPYIEDEKESHETSDRLATAVG